MRAVLHVDMDAFFAAVEAREVPALAERPVIIGGDPSSGRGVVSTCNYPAREYGVHSAMPVTEARRKCPDAVFISPDHAKYRRASDAVMSYLGTVADRMEQLSVDEAYLGMEVDAFSQAVAAATGIRQTVADRFDLTCSVGVSDSCTTAKIASDCNKPEGLTVVPPDRVRAFLADLDVGRIPGVGDRTRERLTELGFMTVGDLQSVSPDRLQDLLGAHGVSIHRKALGEHEREIGQDRRRKSIGTERTFEEDIGSVEEMLEVADGLCDRVIGRVREKGYRFRTVETKIRSAGFDTATRQTTLDVRTADAELLRQRVRAMVREFHDGGAYRLLGVRVSDLARTATRQTELLEFLS